MRGRDCRWMCSTSRNPAVVISATRAPERCSTWLVATVVPWMSIATSAACISARSAASSAPLTMPAAGSSGVEATLWNTRRPRAGS